MMKAYLIASVILFVGIAPSAVAAAGSDSCDSVLLQQTALVSDKQSLLLSYLNLVNNENYESAKRSASAFVPGYFDGSYESLKAKRSKLYAEQRYALSTESSRDEFKSYLNPEQISGWVDCKKQSSVEQLIVYYKDVDAAGATLAVLWNGGAAGALRKLRLRLLPSTTSVDELESLPSLVGTYQVPIARPSTGAPLRGTVSGVAGAANMSFSESFYLPPFNGAVKDVSPPRYVVDLRGVTRSSIAYWANGTKSERFECIAVPENMELLVTAEHQKSFGKTRAYSRCLGAASGGTFCDSAGEACEDIIIDEGCIVNKDWLNWYRAKESALGLKPTDHAACSV
jgi:hypothetical protein